MAEAILLVVSKIGAVVLNETVSAVVEKVSRKLDNLKELPGKINRINTELEAMNAVIQELGTTHLANKVVKSWIGNVRKLAYHVEDVIDKYTYEALKLKDEGFLHRYIFRGSRHIKVFGKIAEEVAEIEDEIKHVKELHIYWSNTVQPTKNEHAQVDRRFFGGCFPELVSDKDLVGIDENRQKLTEWLTTDENENTVSAVSGMGGLGKTALVKNVYDRKKVNFHAHAWIVVSQSYHIVDLLEKFLTEIYKSLKKSKPPVSADTKANVYELTESIQKILQDKKCLIVLDDVWDIEAYTQMRSAFQGLQGSRVVITTRREDVASLAPPRQRLLLQALGSAESFKLFCARAFHNSPDRKCPPELEMLAAAIVDKCHGLPLAIISSGSLLSTKQQTEDAWNHINNHLQSELRGNNHVQAILNLSYQVLPGDLRNCLLYCSLFPEDYVMSLESLVQLWVAEGFAMKKDNSTPEEVAKGNLMELIGRNMLEVVERDRFNKVSTCRMHDIVRDLALAVAKEERFGSANDQGEMMLMDKEVRRFSTFEWSDNKTSALRVEFPRLRTMISLAADSSSTNMISSVLSGSSYLTVLELQDSEITQVPASIGNLFNLRYIGLRRTNVQTLPDTIEKLSNLETLNVRQTRIEKLPPGIVKNEKLRHLSADRFTGEKFRYFAGVEAPRMISNFQQLQTLETVHASKDLSLQLKKMNKLQNVRIDDMNASHCDDLCHALSDMPLLSSLFLSACDEKETLCFQALKPVSKRLHTLIIRGSWGDGALKCPIFQGHGKNLKYLALSWCNLGNEDPLQLLGSSHLPVLTHLSFNWVSTAGVLVLSAGCFSQLKILILRSMSNVKQMVIKEGALPCIDGIYITDLLELSMVPHGIESLGSLKKLWMIDLHKDFKADWDLNQMHSKMKHVPELRTT